MWMTLLAVSSYISEDRASTAIHLPEAFAKTKKATNILRPAIDVSFWCNYEEFWCRALSVLKKKKIEKNFFHHTKPSILKILSKSPRTQIRLLGTPRDFLRSRTTILGGQTFDEDANSEVIVEVGVPEVRFFFHFLVIRGWEGRQK